MKSKFAALFIIFCLLFGLASCKDANRAVPAAGSSKTAVSAVCTSQTTDSDSEAQAYFAVFQKLYETDSGLSYGKYLAIDLSKAKIADKTQLIKLIQNFCSSHGYTLLEDTAEGLKAKGYIDKLFFKDGFLISFDDKELSREKLFTSAKEWKSGDGAIGAEYTVSKENGSWNITKESNYWIS